MGKKKRLFDIEIWDTKPHTSPAKQLVWRGTKTGRYPREALRKTTKMFPKIDFSEWRTSKKKYSRYVFVHGEVK